MDNKLTAITLRKYSLYKKWALISKQVSFSSILSICVNIEYNIQNYISI